MAASVGNLFEAACDYDNCIHQNEKLSIFVNHMRSVLGVFLTYGISVLVTC